MSEKSLNDLLLTLEGTKFGLFFTDQPISPSSELEDGSVYDPDYGIMVLAANNSGFNKAVKSGLPVTNVSFNTFTFPSGCFGFFTAFFSGNNSFNSSFNSSFNAGNFAFKSSFNASNFAFLSSFRSSFNGSFNSSFDSSFNAGNFAFKTFEALEAMPDPEQDEISAKYTDIQKLYNNANITAKQYGLSTENVPNKKDTNIDNTDVTTLKNFISKMSEDSRVGSNADVSGINTPVADTIIDGITYNLLKKVITKVHDECNNFITT